MATPSLVIAVHPNGAVHVNRIIDRGSPAVVMEPACNVDTRLDDPREPVSEMYNLDDPEAPKLRCPDCQQLRDEALAGSS